MNQILRGILNMSYMGSLAILCVLAARILLKKAPRRFSYFLWAAVLFRLLCPFSIENGLGIFPEGRNLMDAFVFSEDTALPAGGNSVSGEFDYSETDKEDFRVRAEQAGLETAGRSENAEGGEEAKASERIGAQSSWNASLTILFGVWLLGVSAMVLYGVFSWRRLAIRLQVSLPEGDGVYLADGIPTPFIVGIRRPRIYLPSDIPEEEKAYALMHEREHIRRRDPLWKGMAFAAVCLHWFNPLVWIAFFCAQKDMEMSCDEAVLAKAGGNIRQAYAAALLNLTAGRRVIGLMPLAFGEGNTGERIRHAVKYKKPGVLFVIGGGVFALLLAFGLIFNSGGLRITEISDKSRLQGFEAQWYQGMDGRYVWTVGDNGAAFVLAGEKTILVYYQGGDGYSYYKAKARMEGSVMRIELREKNAAGEADISDRLLFRMKRPDNVEEYEITLDGRSVPVLYVLDEREWDYPELSELFAMKNTEVEDLSADEKLLEALNINYLGRYTAEVLAEEEAGGLALHFEGPFPKGGESSAFGRSVMRQDAEILMALIANCEKVSWSWSETDSFGRLIRYEESWSAEEAGARMPEPLKEYGVSEKKMEEFLTWQQGMAAQHILYGRDWNY